MSQEPTILQRDPLLVVGMRLRGTPETIPQGAPMMWDRLMQREAEIKQKRNPREAFGVIGNNDPATGELDYVAGFEVADASEVPEGMVSWRVPAQAYAVFPCTLPTLMQTFGYIYRTWLPQSGRERGDGPELELYGEEFDPADSSSRMYVYVPIT